MMSTPEQSYPSVIHVPYIDTKYFNRTNEAIANGIEFLTSVSDQEEARKFFKHFFENTIARNVPEERKQYVLNCKGSADTTILTKDIWFNIGIHEPVPFSGADNAIMKRFAKVFEQSYTRFLDLQKAEAQAKESQIEAALEKVRSRSLAMHRSDELQEVVHTVFEKLKELNVDFYTVIIVIFQENSKDITWWMENKVNQQYPKILVRYADNPYLRDLFEAKENGRELLSKSYLHEEKNEFYNHLFQSTDLKYVAETQKKFLLENEFATMSVAISNNTGIHITSYSRKFFSAEENETLKRFAKVFEQAYIRFMDLQKAEAQAREAQIEAALERVRARTMAMHKSDDLLEVITILSEQFQHLGFDVDIANFNTSYRDKDWNLWLWAQGVTYPHQVHFPYFDHPYFNTIRKSLDEGLELSTAVFTKEEKDSFQSYLYTHVLPDSPEDMRESIYRAKGLAWSVAFSKNTSLTIANFNAEPYSEEQNTILRRFENVFEQSYTRFLDLQKAEAQAREAQIEAALEKVRSRSLAMHHSNELEQVVASLFDRFVELGLSFDGAIIYLFERERKNIQLWVAAKHLTTPIKVNLPYDEMIRKNPIYKDLWQVIEKGGYILNKSYRGKAKDDYFLYTAKHNESKIPNAVRKLQLEAESWTATFAAEKNS
ncbi:MAG TPA: hypothetical protein VGG71_03860, partial [Chitinophagaceae bacterium]